MSSPTFDTDGAHGMIEDVPNNMETSYGTMGYLLNPFSQPSGTNMDSLIGQGGNTGSYVDPFTDPFLYQMVGADASQNFFHGIEMSTFDGTPTPSTTGCSDVDEPHDLPDSSCLGLYNPNDECFLIGEHQRQIDVYAQLVQSIANDVEPDEQPRRRPAAAKRNSSVGKEKKTRKPRASAFSKTVFSYTQIITMTLMNSEQEKATTGMLYAFAEHHFHGLPCSSSLRNNLRRALSNQRFFQRVKDGKTWKRSMCWTFIPERKGELVELVHETVNANRGSMEKLRMTNLNDLPSILNGTHRLPEKVIKYHQPIPNDRQDIILGVQEQIPLFQVMSQRYLAPYVPPNVPTYINQNEAAYQQVWGPYKDAQPAYYGPMYRVAREENPDARSSHPAPYMAVDNDQYAHQYGALEEYQRNLYHSNYF